MRTYFFLALCAAAVISFPTVAHAQAPVSSVSLADPAPPGWDASGHVAWLTVDKGDIAPDWNRWYDTATFGASVGKFVGRHVKLEFDVATSTEAEVFTDQLVRLPPAGTLVSVGQSNQFRMTTMSAAASYQFFDNRWFHPVVGGGVESARETRTIGPVLYPLVPPVTAPEPGTTVTWRTHPFVTAGFKLYLAERAFLRSDVRTSFDSGGVAQVSWRTGIGVDF